ncbi:hypothetical protein EDF56_103225 [Novosphingobium sp. PhB165]|nr:hypothetical protein EDF56_103225 [Novosphingobium sp. PhB165]
MREPMTALPDLLMPNADGFRFLHAAELASVPPLSQPITQSAQTRNLP